MNSTINFAFGPVHPQVVCPHCGVRGPVHLKKTKQKKGVSGGKATAAVLTGGVSILATGLSRKEKGMQAFCENCRVKWML
jgi:DNA-directed RNA polymerase subunit RPC12/RpoP